MSRHADAAVVTGALVIAAATRPFRGATAHIYLEDISYADAAAVVVAEATLPGVVHDPSTTGGRDSVIPFSLRMHPSAAILPGNDYAVRAWVDRDGDGTTCADDLYSDQSYRVLTRGFGRTVTIALGTQ
jgi:uncharacterized lipoprotein YbaY